MSGAPLRPTVAIPRTVIAAMASHATREAPDECCGLLVGTPERIDESVPATNVRASPVRFQVDPAEHFALQRRLRGTGRSIVGAYHSHVGSDAVPSPADVAESHYPEFVNLIVSLKDPGGAVVRAFRISGAEVTEVPLAIEESG